MDETRSEQTSSTEASASGDFDTSSRAERGDLTPADNAHTRIEQRDQGTAQGADTTDPSSRTERGSLSAAGNTAHASDTKGMATTDAAKTSEPRQADGKTSLPSPGGDRIWAAPDPPGSGTPHETWREGASNGHAPEASTRTPGRVDVTAEGKAQEPRPSTDYGPGQLDNKAGKNIEKERDKHTKAADRAARAEAKSATGNSTKVTGKGVEYHHHADVKESKRVGLNPDVAGEKNRMSALDSRRDPKHPSTIGDNSDWRNNPSRTPHNIAKSIDKKEQARTASAINKDGNPRLPADHEGRKGLTDASATSKQRLPATADRAERAIHNWDRTQPKGPPVNERGEVTGSKAEGATAKMEQAEAKAAAAATAKGAANVETTSLPKGETLNRAAKGAIDAADKLLHGASRLAGAVGHLFNAREAALEIREVMARETPQLLPEGSKVPLTMSPDNYRPAFNEPSGYTVEKTDGQVIYRDAAGTQVSRDEAIKNSTGTVEDRDRRNQA
jgi:hypothetical protein